MWYLKFLPKDTIQTQGSMIKFKLFKYVNTVPSIRKASTQRIVPKTTRKHDFRMAKPEKKLDAFGFLMFCIPVSTFALGCWQVKRKKWKEDLIESVMSKTNIPAVDLPLDENELHDMEYRRFRVRGEFDHSAEMYVGPRSRLVAGESAYGSKLISSSSNDSVGYYVVTPFILSDTKEKILVNRGWVPFPQKNPKTRVRGQVEGEIEIEGILRKTEPRTQFMPPDKPSVNVFMTRNVEKMAKITEAMPIFLDATVESTIPDGPIGGQTRASFRNEHLSYIITWFSLSAATGAMYYTKYLRK